MMVDLVQFSNSNFDPKKWINTACHSRHSQQSLDKHLIDLEMKLQMLSEEISASLEEQSSAALLHVPRATRDVVRLRDDAGSLRSAVSVILHNLQKAEGSSAESIAALAKVDVVKQRMEAAYETLQDAAGLTQLSSTVEDVFTSGDLPRAAETLANMRHCLSAVGEVAEFANIRKQLEVLEDRLDTMVQPPLTDALSNRKIDAAQDLRGVLIRIGRFKSLESQYSKVHLKPIKKLWEDLESREHASKSANEKSEMETMSTGGDFQSSPTISFSNWLPSFYDELLLYLEQEWKWCMVAFPEDYKTLVPKLLSDTMMAIGASFISHINLAIGDAVPETKALAKGLSDILSGDMQKGIKLQTKHLESLIELHNITGTFARNIQHLFSGCDVLVLMDVLKSVYLPYESFKQRYGQMERAILSSEIAGIDLRGAVIRRVGAQGVELSETIRRMEESIPQVIILLEAAAERCISFTGGSEADELILALDDIMLKYISTLQETLKSLRTVCGVDYGGDGTGKKDENQNARKVDLISNEEEWSMVQGALQILTVADSLTSRSSVFEASLRATLARFSTTLSFSAFGSSLDQNQIIHGNEYEEPSFGGRASLDMATLRLVNVPEKARKLFSLLNQSKDPRFHALPLASQRVAAFEDMVNELVYDVLISKVRQCLSDVSRLPIWSSVEEQSAFHLPAFSAYPQSYVTSVGEYLLTLPQQLEPLAEGISTGEANDEAQFFATEWMFKIAEGATTLYIEQLRGIQYITDRGAQQLSVDIDYLSNVLSALSMPIPAVLTTFHSCLSTSRDQLKDLLKTDSANHLDLPTANLVCKMRRVNLDS
ncbi:putative oligomeric Golgi complex subunit 7 protein [Medicago truncatula]|uniref:Conserved oligomeric Golgi complex subunit 7 n=2 Tax=Medicago truncatula TaxID=3880 RepID=G7KHJ7_MEDTR|nr:conserved oligomeric Golgi complex subunit 7 [Medicago truncatula]AES74409.1 oligomeric component-related/COG complex component [Medicago truncatula]RHN49751.1 putative oligomeric Golgi complex subunit 7 protein [Medicago truncatula]